MNSMLPSAEPLAVVVVHQDQVSSLEKLLASLHTAAVQWGATSQGLRAESSHYALEGLRIFVYDNGSTPQNADRVKDFFSREQALWNRRLKLIRSAVPRSFGSAANETLAHCERRGFVFFMSPEAEVNPDFWSTLYGKYLKISAEKPRFAIPLCVSMGRSFLGEKWNRFLTRSNPVLEHESNSVFDSFSLGGAMFPVSMLLGAGAWNSHMDSADACHELSLRLLQQGWAPYPMPELVLRCVYNRRVSEGDFMRSCQARAKILGLYPLKKKWEHNVAKFVLSVERLAGRIFFAGLSIVFGKRSARS